MPNSLFANQETHVIGNVKEVSNGWFRDTRFACRTAWLILVCIAAIATHYPVVNAEFLLFDDPEAVTENTQVLRGLTWESIQWAFRTLHFSNWMPVTWLSLMLDTTLFGSGPAGYHTTNLVLHVLSTAILLLILYRLSDKTLPCVFAAALFAVHPLNVQAVAWIAERKGLLSSFFWLAGLLAYLHYVANPSLRRYLLVSLCLVLSLMSKQMAVTFAAGLLLLDYWPLRRIRATGDNGQSFRHLAILEKLPWFAIGIVFIGIGFVAQNLSGALGDTRQYPVGIRLKYAIVGFMEYLRKALLPIDLQFHYHRYNDGPSASLFFISLILLLCLVALTVVYARRLPALFVGFWWFAITLLPVSGILQIGQQRLADRYVYMPLIGIFVCFAAILFGRSASSLLSQRIRAVVAVAFVVILGVKANLESKYWHDDYSLYERALTLDPRNTKALVNLGNARKRSGELDIAKGLYANAISIDPLDYHAHHNLGRLYSARGESGLAIEHYKSAIASAGTFPMAVNNLGIEYLASGDYELAQPLFEANLRDSPESDFANGNLATCHFRQKNFSLAVDYYRQAVRLAPLNASWHFQLARSLALMEHWDEAETAFLATRSLSPRVGDAIRGCAMAQAHQGKIQSAMSCLRDLVALDGGQGSTFLQMAFLMMTSRETIPDRDAMVRSLLENLNKEVALSADWLSLVKAVQMAESRDFRAAIELANQAISKASSPDNFEFVSECERAIKTFQNGKPYRLGPE